MKIAIIGTRGIPANYGGFETFAEELSVRLVVRGHEVMVYCRGNNARTKEKMYKGVRRVILPTISHKYLDTVIHVFLSVMHVIFTRTEVVYFCNPITSIYALLPRLLGKKTMVNVDGLEWKRKKWNFLAKSAYRLSEIFATIFPHRVITDSLAIQQYYKDRFNKETS